MRAKGRVTAVTLIMVATLMPFGSTAEADHCTTPITILSGRGLLFNPGFVGCTVGEDDMNTDLITPGSTALIVRWLSPFEPEGTTTFSFSGITGPTRTCTVGESCELNWTRGTDTTGEPANYWDSQVISISTQSSLTGGEAIARVCEDPDDFWCEERIYRTAG